MLRYKNTGETLTFPAGSSGDVQLQLILLHFAPRKLICSGMLQYKNNLIQPPFPLRIAGPKQYKTTKLFTTRIRYSARRRLPPPPFLFPPPLLCLTFELRWLAVSRPMTHAGPRPSVLFLFHREGSHLAPLSLFWYVHVCRFPWWLSIGLLPRPCLLLVAFVGLFVWCWFSLLCLAASFSRRAFLLLPPLFGLFVVLVVCGCVALWLLPSLPFPPPWRMAVLTSGSAGPTPCCLRLGIGLLPQRPECLACWYCFLFSGAVTGWSRDGVCPVPFRHRAVWQQRLRPCLCGVLPSTPRCACRSCFLASPF